VQRLQGSIQLDGWFRRQWGRDEGTHLFASGAGDLVTTCAKALHQPTTAKLEQGQRLLKAGAFPFNKPSHW
jgi:hypothetical protein